MESKYLHIFFLIFGSNIVFSQLIPESYSIKTLNDKLQKHFARNGTVEEITWLAALPDAEEIAEMNELISNLFEFPDFSTLPGTYLGENFRKLNESLELSILQDGRYCVIHEKILKNLDDTWVFPRFWGYVVIRSRCSAQRINLHHSSPHFQSDARVGKQSAVVFEETGSRSFVVAGASRFAVIGNKHSPCQWNDSRNEYFAADAAHTTGTMFHVINSAIFESMNELNLPGQLEYFIQWHGMDDETCPSTDVFISAGINGRDPAIAAYSDSNSPINKLVSQIKAQSTASGNSLRAETPATLLTCKLRAEDNVFGRLVNGVVSTEVCDTKAIRENVGGQFIHIEQVEKSRDVPLIWSSAVQNVFPILLSTECDGELRLSASRPIKCIR